MNPLRKDARPLARLSTPPPTRKLRVNRTATISRIGGQELAQFHADTLRRIFRGERPMAAAIARAADVSPRTAENYISDPPLHSPNAQAIANLMKNCKAYEAAWLDMIHRHAEYPDIERIVTEAVQREIRGRGR